MDDTEKRTRIARALGIAEGWVVADGVEMASSRNPRIVRLMGLADVAIEATGDDDTIAALRRDILRLESDRDAAMQSARLAQETVERAIVAGEKVHRELAETHEKHAMEFQRADKYRSELADARAEINDILPELDAVRSMGTQLERELAARTEEWDAARKALEAIAAHEGPDAGDGGGMSCGCLESAPTAAEIKHPEWCAYRVATEALAVLREEQTADKETTDGQV